MLLLVYFEMCQPVHQAYRGSNYQHEQQMLPHQIDADICSKPQLFQAVGLRKGSLFFHEVDAG